MAISAFMQIDSAQGELMQPGFEGWIPVQNWDWEVAAETNFTKGGGAMIGKPNPGSLNWEHIWDTASPAILGYLATGSAFDTVKLHMAKTTGKATLQVYWTATMNEVFITKVNTSVTDEGAITQKVEMVFRMIKIEYKPQSNVDGSLGAPKTYQWNIVEGDAEPGA